jgi:signal peptidase II
MFRKNLISSMKKKRIVAILLCLILIWIDQLTKYLFYDLEIWSQLFFLEPLLNDGISRWMSMPMVVILSISVICVWLFIYLFHKKYLTTVEFALLFAGTIWNLIDRIYLWWVRDFLSFGSFPVFNIADSFLTCGVAWICIKEIFHLQKK